MDDSSIRNEYNIAPDDTVLFFMGFIYEFAGMKELAIELGKNKDKYPKMKILIVGDGDAYERLKEIKEEYDLGDQLSRHISMRRSCRISFQSSCMSTWLWKRL